ncbi:hypothetical protein EDB19DRAFT_1222219 [Suillus lakei]|nr:hypothetical protein EDB19DRAFT_1222219 [Suillus lakei]
MRPGITDPAVVSNDDNSGACQDRRQNGRLFLEALGFWQRLIFLVPRLVFALILVGAAIVLIVLIDYLNVSCTHKPKIPSFPYGLERPPPWAQSRTPFIPSTKTDGRNSRITSTGHRRDSDIGNWFSIPASTMQLFDECRESLIPPQFLLSTSLS